MSEFIIILIITWSFAQTVCVRYACSNQCKIFSGATVPLAAIFIGSLVSNILVAKLYTAASTSLFLKSIPGLMLMGSSYLVVNMLIALVLFKITSDIVRTSKLGWHDYSDLFIAYMVGSILALPLSAVIFVFVFFIRCLGRV